MYRFFVLHTKNSIFQEVTYHDYKNYESFCDSEIELLIMYDGFVCFNLSICFKCEGVFVKIDHCVPRHLA